MENKDEKNIGYYLGYTFSITLITCFIAIVIALTVKTILMIF